MRTLTTCFLLLFTLLSSAVSAQKGVYDENPRAVAELLDRIGGRGASGMFETVVDEAVSENGNETFIITSRNSKPCVKGSSILAVTTGINWYLNHYAHVNISWNNLTTDFSSVDLPLPKGEEKHICNARYRYNFNYCTFSYSTAFWTWERWQQEIDWMALHGINMPLQLVGLEVLWRNVLKDKRVGYSDEEIAEFIAGPGFMAWFAMNNLEGWGAKVDAPDVVMNGNPDWWYMRQEKLCRRMLERMRELGMKPVLPGYCGMVPNSMAEKSVKGVSSADIIDSGTWAGGYTRPDIIRPRTDSFNTIAEIYYEHLEKLMGVSEFYSMDPFHEGGVPVDKVSIEECYKGVMEALDVYYSTVSKKKRGHSGADDAKWIVQYWQGLPAASAFDIMDDSYSHRFIALDLFADAQGKAKWNSDYFAGCDYIFCMLHNFGGRSGMHGRLESTMNDYFKALERGGGMCGVGATPEGIETNPILYDLLFELPWLDPDNVPSIDTWLRDYAYARYGVDDAAAVEALMMLKESVWGCPTDQQGTSEAVILARPSWSVDRVSSWSTSNIYWDTQKVLAAADRLISIKEKVTAADGTTNYSYDLIDVVRQSLVDLAYTLVKEIKHKRDAGDSAEYERLYRLYLQLMLDIDELLSYDENFRLEKWTKMACDITDEVSGTTLNDKRWLEWNARTQVTVWSDKESNLNDYSNRCWAGLIKDFHYTRWKYFFENDGQAPQGGWYSSFERGWTLDYTSYDYSTYKQPCDKTATEKAVEVFNSYFGRYMSDGKVLSLYPLVMSESMDIVCNIGIGTLFTLPFVADGDVEISHLWIDFNSDNVKDNCELLVVCDNNRVDIPCDVAVGMRKAAVIHDNGVSVCFNAALYNGKCSPRTVSVISDGNGVVGIGNVTSVTTALPVEVVARPNEGYSFSCWVDADGNRVSNAPCHYYFGEQSETLKAEFVVDKWGVPQEDVSDMGDIRAYSQYINRLTVASEGEHVTIYEAAELPAKLFNLLSQTVDVPRGSCFEVKWSDNDSDGLKYCYLSAYIDLNADGDFDDEGELIVSKGKRDAVDATLSDCTVKVLLPYEMPLGVTHMRLRFDGAWKSMGYNAANCAYDSKAQLNRMCYELPLNITACSSVASQVRVVSDNGTLGRVTVKTDETPGDTKFTGITVTRSVPFTMIAEPADAAEFVEWRDAYGRTVSKERICTMYAPEDAVYTAVFRKR